MSSRGCEKLYPVRSNALYWSYRRDKSHGSKLKWYGQEKSIIILKIDIFFLFFYKFMKKIKEHHKTCILCMFYRLILFFKLIMVWKIFCASILLAKTHFQSWNQVFLSQLIWLLLWHGYYKDFWYLEHIKITAFLISSGKVRIACDRIERPLTFCDESHCLVSDSAIPVPPGLFPCPLKAKPGGNKYLCSSWLSLV